MKKYINFGIILFCAWHASNAFAFDAKKQVCPDSITQVIEKHIAVDNFKSQHARDGGVIIAEACKASPTDASQSIAVFAYDADADGKAKVVVALVDTSKRKVVSIYHDTISQDASLTLGEGSFQIDTARYNLAQHIRAFGVNMTSTDGGHGCYDGGLGAERRLFALIEGKIKPILEGFFVSTWRYTKGGATCNGGMGDQSTEEFSYSIAMGNTKTNGLANLHISGTSSDHKRKRFSYVLRYDGNKYPMNGLQNAIYKWQEKSN